MDWREYQRQAQAFFASLRMDAETDVSIQGARGTHAIDVLVCFQAFGVEHLWIVECKYWRRRIPKEKVLALRAIVDDVGADRGFLLSESGFQSGAVTAARLSSITLSNLEDLRANAEADVRALRLDDLYGRLAALRGGIEKLTRLTRRDEHSGGMTLKPGMSSDEYFRTVGTLSFLEYGLQRARVGQYPIAYGPDESGEGVAVAHDLPTFLDRAGNQLTELEAWVSDELERPWPTRPGSRQGNNKA